MVAGYMVEYSGMKFAMCFIAEYVNMFAVAIIISTLFLGGYKFFGLEDVAPVLSPVIVFAKAVFVIFIMLWFRGTFPRMRFDQLVSFAWKFFVPLALVNLMVAALVVKIPASNPKAVPWIQWAVMLAANLVVIAVTFFILNRAARRIEGPSALKRIVAAER
jgi:NADH-quinone oxidoreductase subunit H